MFKAYNKLGSWHVYRAHIVILGIIIIHVGRPVNAQIVRTDDPALAGIDIIERAGDTIPLDIRLTDETGQEVVLSDYFSEEKPVIIVMAYYTCPMLCNLVLSGVAQTAAQLSWLPGEEYRILTISIDSTESYKLAAEKKENYIKSMKRPEAAPGWLFFTATGDQSRKLADALGFQYYYDEQQKQYAHAAVVFVLTPKGSISRYLYGIEFPKNDFKMALMEAAGGNIGSNFDRILLYCYHYDPDAGGYVLLASRVMTLGGAGTLLVLSILLGGLWLYDIRRRRQLTANSETQVTR